MCRCLGRCNASAMTGELSNAWCQLATGSSYTGRKLYTDADEMVQRMARPSIVNGINSVAVNADLLSRTWAVTLEVPVTRRSETEINDAFQRLHAKALGALLDAVCCALRNYRNIKPGKDRLADAEVFVSAAEPALGWGEGTFKRVLHDNREKTALRALDEHEGLVAALTPLAAAGWTGTATDLLGELRYVERVPDGPSPMRALLGKLQPVLVAKDIVVNFYRKGKGGEKIISLKLSSARSVATEDNN